MATDFNTTGAFNVNDQWVTTVRYDATIERGAFQDVQLRFMNGRNELANIKVRSDEARELLGEKNFSVLAKVADEAQGPGHNNDSLQVKGELRGKSLEFRQVLLPGYSLPQDENAIRLDARIRAAAPDPLKAATENGTGGARVTSAQEGADPAARGGRTVADQGAEVAGERAGALPSSDLEAQAQLRRLRAGAVPDAVAQRFLKVDDRYYFPDKKLAFTDRGTKLKAETNNLEVVRSVVSIAEARGWEALTVTGSNDFRKEVWREARLRGMDVRGHESTELERQDLQRALEKRFGANEIQREPHERAVDPATRDIGFQPTAPMQGAADAQLRGDQRLLTGRLIEAGAATYKFDANEKPSYYVKVQTDRGERTVWGVDLERALAESKSGAKLGDLVTIENQGSRPVTVKASVRDKEGHVVGEKGVNAHRNAWVVEKQSYFDERAERAVAFRNGDRAKQELVARYPDLTNAIATMRLGELFAEKLIDRPEDRERVVNSLRDILADALERGETIQAPKINEAAVRKLDKIAGEVDEVAQRAAVEQITKGAREVGARTRGEPQHVRA